MRRQQITTNDIVWFNQDLLTEPVDKVFDPVYWQTHNRVLGSATGRGITWFVQTEKMAAALRHYRRGGLFGKIVKDNYLFTSWRHTRSHAEYVLLDHLSKQGVHVPRPIAARALRKGLFYQADLLSELIPNAQDLISILKERSLSAQEYRAIGAEIKKMHNVYVNHTDLNIHNILLDKEGKVWLIDFDKCAVKKGEDWKKKNLSRLLRSFKKEQEKAQIHWQENEFDALLAGYQA